MYDCVMSHPKSQPIFPMHPNTQKEHTMHTRRVNGKPEAKPIPCPQCGQWMAEGKALLTSAMITGTAYICASCKVIYLPDLKPFARMVVGVN